MLGARKGCWCGRMRRSIKVREQEVFITYKAKIDPVSFTRSPNPLAASDLGYPMMTKACLESMILRDSSNGYLYIG
jgi:hypothetical protein